MGRITKIEANKKLRVAAYARVSTGSDDQLISLEAQKNHYERLIKSRSDWEFAGLYFDEGISGTKMAKRDGLLSMIVDCERGQIDYILVKSISRFSRNTVESIELREERQEVLTAAAERKDLQLRMQELIDFLEEQQSEITEYNETLTRRLVEKVTIFDEKIVVTLKSGMEMKVAA